MTLAYRKQVVLAKHEHEQLFIDVPATIIDTNDHAGLLGLLRDLPAAEPSRQLRVLIYPEALHIGPGLQLKLLKQPHTFIFVGTGARTTANEVLR
jgi:hypothetical protein